MVIDSSALVAILLGEEEAEHFTTLISSDPRRLMSPVSMLETSIVMEAKKGPAGGRELDLFVYSAQIEMAGMNREQAEIARQAYRRFGKGQHPARLNLGDCCSYALARHSGERLLCKGNDFPLTDIPLC
ncbi:type II toxin-antitoxin system VapC family toxin [bacterium]|nr:type II toxin-antitoxin system VapC family toxin [bacterium]